ncbi:MAG: FAD dependent oxidoreductase [Parcubacteria group bacterium Gr01-1014_49]|nr:MAG: FAD dependent oxidoreductase [Parcubacteria group bacterium Gr01-1014_49]
MIPNNSPWIQQLKRTRPVVPLEADAHADVAIVGGGIAGAVTAFFTLRDTDKSVILFEADKVAHGATGHNAGQIASYFERPLSELVEEFGLELAIDGQRSVESAWALIDQIVAEAGLRTPLYRFTGYTGLSTLDQVILHLKDNRCRVDGGLQNETLIVAEEWMERKDIPGEYRDLYGTVPQKDILNLLETNSTDYIASLAFQKGCMNSALFTEELIGYLITKYQDRFSFYEGSPVKTVRLKEHTATLEVLGHTVEVGKVVLCTNGFEHFSIINEAGQDIDTEFHHSIAGRIGYMSGYVEPFDNPPVAVSYFPRTNERIGDPTGESYFYLTRRPYESDSKSFHSLVCAGGPEKVLPSGADYSPSHSCSEDTRDSIDDFLRSNYSKHPGPETEYAFCWHGLMGYTPSGIRRVGPEPCNPTLLYNLGCNGVGILPSVFGGKRISEFLGGKQVKPSLFDPHDQRV